MPIFDPLGAIWLLMCLGVAWLLWRKQWRSAAWLAAPVLLIFLLGSTGIVDAIVARDEEPWAGRTSLIKKRGRNNESTHSVMNPDAGSGDPAYNGPVGRVPPRGGTSGVAYSDPLAQNSHKSADAVVVLGGAHYFSDEDVFGFGLGNGASRLITGLELMRSGQAGALVLGGSTPTRNRPGASASANVQDWIMASGFVTGTVMNLGLCADTHAEALRFRELQSQKGWSNALLVTSALHMKRSEATFKMAGVDVVPVPCDFQAYGVPRDESFSIIPRQRRFHLLSLYVHEKIGWFVYRWKRWV